jgi:glyoxylase-like metal-dependent hydrolase (beta-lactamase superfamily II)
MSDEEWYQETIGLLVEAGASEDDIDALPTPGDVHRTSVASPDRVLADGERADVPGWELEAIWTPGHTPGHLCFAETLHQLLLSGDHLLPDLSPHIGLVRADAPGDPLSDYLASLDKLTGRGFREVLPAHQHRFRDADARVAQLREHHDQRLAEVIGIVRTHEEVTAWQLAERMTWSRPWDTFRIMTRRTAVAEALAHIRLLERRGVLARVSAQQHRWRLADTGDGHDGPAEGIS